MEIRLILSPSIDTIASSNQCHLEPQKVSQQRGSHQRINDIQMHRSVVFQRVFKGAVYGVSVGFLQ